MDDKKRLEKNKGKILNECTMSIENQEKNNDNQYFVVFAIRKRRNTDFANQASFCQASNAFFA